jgi:glycerol-3-phosphate acyltransferase PlsY
MVELLKVLAMGIVAYSLGSISFSVMITRWKAGIDVRSVGSGHAGATNTMRAAGWIAGILVLVLDIGKGYLAVWLARQWVASPWGMVVAAGMVIVGHCWPIFAGFRGGMGMASGGGALLAIWPLGLVLAVGVGALSQLVVRHSARANVITGVLVMPLWALFGANALTLVAAAVVGVLVALRARSDWYREYRELWWDRG